MLFMLVYVGHARVKPASFPDLLQQVYKLLSSCVQGTLVWTAWHMQKMRVSLPNASKILWKGISTSPPPSHHRPRSCQWKWKDFRLPLQRSWLDRDIPVKRQQHPKQFTAAVLELDNPGSACWSDRACRVTIVVRKCQKAFYCAHVLYIITSIWKRVHPTCRTTTPTETRPSIGSCNGLTNLSGGRQSRSGLCDPRPASWWHWRQSLCDLFVPKDLRATKEATLGISFWTPVKGPWSQATRPGKLRWVKLEFIKL